MSFLIALMKFAIQINASPTDSSAGLTAYHFIQAALEKNHQIIRVFFYRGGVYHALRSMTPPDDELHLTGMWSALAKQQDLDLVVCISAAQRRGLLHVDEAARIGKQDNDLADGFRLAGLGQWLEASLQADRCLVFA